MGSRYSGQRDAVADAIRSACGGSLCVTFDHEFDGSADPETLDCTVTDIRQPEPLEDGDHVVFVLGSPCGPEDGDGS